MHGLTRDDVANLGAQSARRHEIHRSPEQALEVALELEEREEPHGAGEVNEEIDVAVDSGLAPSRRAVEPKSARDRTPSRVSSARCPASFVNTASRSFMSSLVVLDCLPVEPGTALSGRITEEAQLGWPLAGSIARRSNCESPISYTGDRNADGNLAGSP
jgi:hypothetical protein